MFNLYKSTHVCLIQRTTELSNSSIGHNAVCKLWCLHSVEAEEHSVIELTDTDVSKERNGHKNNLMIKAVEINLHCFYFFFLAHVNLSIFFETSGSVKPIMQCNFPVWHSPHITLSFTRKVKCKMSWVKHLTGTNKTNYLF
jgi:hypothetical protein